MKTLSKLYRGENPVRRSPDEVSENGISSRNPDGKRSYQEVLGHIAACQTDSPFTSLTSDFETAQLHKGVSVGSHCVIYEIHIPEDLEDVLIWNANTLLKEWKSFGLISREYADWLNQAIDFSLKDSEFLVYGTIPPEWIAEVYEFNRP